MSGNIKGSSPITLIGPKGELELKEGCIIADRHIHMLPEQARLYGLEGVEKVSETRNRDRAAFSLTWHNARCRNHQWRIGKRRWRS